MKISSKKLNTAHLADVLKQILREGKANNQEIIKEELKKHGFDLNQTKISRLLRKLGAVKITNERQEIVYTLPYDPAPVTARNVLSELVLEINHNDNLIVIRTNPGSASLIGRLLDHNSKSLEILGTVAGDDTIFIAPVQVKALKKTFKLISEFVKTMS